MANTYKNFKKYNKAIELYTNLINQIDDTSEIYADLLYKRGGSFERIGDYKNSDNDLIKSLEIVPEDPYVMNYLAYSWLERKYKIDVALEMLKDAYEKKKNDPYIIDSVGWAYFLVEDYEKAEKYLRNALLIMPEDPIVNDHYGDVMWKLGMKLQASYYWNAALLSDEAEEKLIEDINYKLLFGLTNL